MKKFIVPIMVTRWGEVTVEAESPVQAEDLFIANPVKYEASFEESGEAEYEITDDIEEAE